MAVRFTWRLLAPALALVVLIQLALPAGAAAGEFEQAEVVSTFGSGAAIVRNGFGDVYGVVYAGMDGSHPEQDAFLDFNQDASRANAQQVSGQTVRVERLRIMGQTPEGMLVVVGHVYLPGRDAPAAADLLGSGYGWYRPDPDNAFDGLFAQLEAVARAQHNGVWGWPVAVPNLGPTPPPTAPPDFARRPVPDDVGLAWDALVGAPDGSRFAAEVARSGVRFQLADLDESWAAYSPRANRVFLDRSLVDERAAAVAAVLAHEITHAVQDHGPSDDCVGDEVEAFTVQSKVWTELSGPDPPIGTRLERQLTLILRVYQRDGAQGLRQLVVRQPGYREECGLAA